MFLNQLPFFLQKDMFRQFQMIQWLEMPKDLAPMSLHYGAKTMCITFSRPE